MPYDPSPWNSEKLSSSSSTTTKEAELKRRVVERGGGGRVEFFGGGGGGVAFSGDRYESSNFETCVEPSSSTRLKWTDSLLTRKRKSLSLAFDEEQHK